jgi:hypothetical protein
MGVLMDSDYAARVLHLERALLAHGVERVGYDAAGDPDRAELLAQLARLGFSCTGPEACGYAWSATIRHPNGASATATAACPTTALFEAAIGALEAAPRPRARSRNQGPGANWLTWRRARPGKPTRLPAPPALT